MIRKVCFFRTEKNAFYANWIGFTNYKSVWTGKKSVFCSPDVAHIQLLHFLSSVRRAQKVDFNRLSTITNQAIIGCFSYNSLLEQSESIGKITFQCTVKPVLVATFIKQATCLKRPVFPFPVVSNKYKHTCIKHVPALSKHFFKYPLGACLIQVGLHLVEKLLGSCMIWSRAW